MSENKRVIFDYKTLKLYEDGTTTIKEGLFDKTADEIAQDWGNLSKSTKKTQIRKFFDEVKNINIAMHSVKNEDGYKKFEPRFSMLRSKIAYAVGRRVCDKNFQDFFVTCRLQIKNLDDFDVFVNLFECVYGFFCFYSQEKNN